MIRAAQPGNRRDLPETCDNIGKNLANSAAGNG